MRLGGGVKLGGDLNSACKYDLASIAYAGVDFGILWRKFQQSAATDPRKRRVELLELGFSQYFR